MLLLKNIAQVVTLGGGPVPRTGPAMSDLGIIENGAIIIRGDRIVWVGPTKDLPVREPGIRYQTLDGVGLDLVALPGFIDSHTHPIFTGSRFEEYELRLQAKSSAETAAIGPEGESSVEQFGLATIQQLMDKTERYCRLFLSHGTTTIEGKSGFGLTLEDEIKSLKTLSVLRERSRLEIVPTFLGAPAISRENEKSRSDYIRTVAQSMIPQIAREGLAVFCDVICENGYLTMEEARMVLGAAKDSGLGLRVHANEYGPGSGAKLAAEIGALSADHVLWIDDSDIEALKRAGTVATLLPAAAFSSGLMHYAPARKLIAAGVPVALGTGFNPRSCFTLNMQLILALACTQMKMTPAEAVTAATINGAFSLGISERLGSIEEGKEADIVLMDASDYRELPYFFGVNHCVVTIKKGNIIINRLEHP